jgi:CRISPR-associated helicase Cas3
VLLAFVRSKFFFLRLWALQQKVIIVDELHSYSPYMLQLLAQALPVLKELGCTVIILSATLTQRAKSELLSASGLTDLTLPERVSNSQAMHVNWAGSLSVQPLDTSDCTAHPEVQVHKHRMALDVRTAAYQRVIDEAVKHARGGEKVLWVCNTVRAAQEVYVYAKVAGAQVPLGLIHSRFTATDRRQREKQWLEFFANEAGGCLLIGTQVLEQSIDLDSDRLFSELAPIDLVIQRAGRLWRKFQSARAGQAAPLHILMPVSQEAADFGGGWKVYDNRFELLRAQRILPDRFDKNMAWELLELAAEPETKREAELVTAYREQVAKELLLAIARGVSMDDVLMEDDEDDEGSQDDPPDEQPVVRLTKIPTIRICIMQDKETFWDGSKRQKTEGLSAREMFELRRAVELNTVPVPMYLFTRGAGTLWDRETRTQTWIAEAPETWGGLCYSSELGAFPA